MWLINRIKELFGIMFKSMAGMAYPEANPKLSDSMQSAMGLWREMMNGKPPWINKDDDIFTIRFGNFVGKRAANLTTLDIGVEITGSSRADWMQKQYDLMVKGELRDQVQKALLTGGIIMKPTGESVEFYDDANFLITSAKNGVVTGAIFRDVRHYNDKVYTRYEWNYVDENGMYWIRNKAYVSEHENEKGREVPLSVIDDWAELPVCENYVRNNGEPIEKPLFAYFANPCTNTIDASSPYGQSIIADAVEEIKGLDIAWSRNDMEVEDSKHVTFIPEEAVRYDEMFNPKKTLPRFMRGVELGAVNDGGVNNIHEHVATLLTEQRWKDINNRLSFIGTKCGFSQGAFGIDKQTGMITATQVEADDRDTIQTIKDIRDALKNSLDDLFHALDVIADVNGYAPTGKYETVYNFGDITYNYEEDRANWWNYVIQGMIPRWKFFEKFEGMSREEYEELEKELNTGKSGLFNDEE